MGDEEAFAAADTNMDGVVTLDELRAQTEAAARKMAEERRQTEEAEAAARCGSSFQIEWNCLN